MEQENKNKLAQSLETIKILMTKWERVKNIAEDILAYINRDVRRFKIEIDLAAGLRLIRIWIAGTDRYVYYGESASELSLKQIYERFFEDNEALVNMVRRLAEAVAEIAEEKVEELKEQLEE